MSLEAIMSSVENNLVNGNRSDALSTLSSLEPLQAAYVATMTIQSNTVTDSNKSWLMGQMLNACRPLNEPKKYRVFAYASTTGSVIPCGYSERGAKQSASIYGSVSVGYISSINNMYIETHRKEKGRWQAV